MSYKLKIQEFLVNIDTQAIVKLLGGAVILVLLSLGVTHYIGEEQITSWVEKAGRRGPGIIIAWKASTVIIAPLSGTATYIIAGGLFGTWRGSIYNLIGNALGMTLGFYIGRIRGIDVVKRLVGKKSAHMVEDLTTKLEDIKTLTITRIILFPLEDLINFACGMSKLRYPVFLLISLVITSIVATVWVWIGDILF